MPTRSSSSAARSFASLLAPCSKCVSSASRIWRPIVSTGFRLVIGSWKIIAISRPRIPRSSSSESWSRSRPPKSAVPVGDAARARAGSRAARATVTLLPQPDSPTIPSVSPGAMSNEIPLTAWIVPREVQNSTRRSSTDRRAPLWPLGPTAELRVERLAQAVADQVEAEHRDHDRSARGSRRGTARSGGSASCPSASSPTPASTDPAGRGRGSRGRRRR